MRTSLPGGGAKLSTRPPSPPSRCCKALGGSGPPPQRVLQRLGGVWTPPQGLQQALGGSCGRNFDAFHAISVTFQAISRPFWEG